MRMVKLLNNSWKQIRSNITNKTFSAGLVAAIFGFTGPALIVIDAANSGGLSHNELISWIFSIYVFGGLFSLFMSIKYRQPIIGAYSIAGAVLIAGTISAFPFQDIIGAYVIAHTLVFIFSITGLVDKIMKYIPTEIVMAMIVGVLIHFAIEMIQVIEVSPFITLATIIAFLLSTRLLKKVSPVLIALIIAIVTISITGDFQFSGIESSFVLPSIIFPTFSWGAILSVSIPLALIIICVENAQAISILKSAGYQAPNKAISRNGSLFSLVAVFFGAHSINVAGPMTAICTPEEVGPKEGRFTAGVFNGVFMVTFGLLSSLIIPFILAMPGLILTLIASLAMLGVMMTALKSAFSSNSFQMSAFFALIIGMSGISFFNISAPLWAILGSLFVAFIVEKEHFVKRVY